MRKYLLAFLLLLLFVLTGCSNYEAKYNEYHDKYDELEMKYEKLYSLYSDSMDKLGASEDDLITVYCYFENENDVTFDEAYDSFDRLRTVIRSLIY